MYKASRTAILFIVFLINFSSSSPQTIKHENLFYMVDREESFESFKKNLDQISIVSPQVFSLSESGVIWGSVDQRIMKLAKENNIKVMPLIVNPGFNLDLFHNFLHSDSSRQRAINMMVEIAEANNFYGWQFDYENIHVSDKDIFTQFYKETADALHKKGFTISIAVVPRNKNFAGAKRFNRFLYEYWKSAYDLKALAEIGDFISLMTYSQHTRRTPPGPVAGLPWFESMIRFTLDQGVPPEKLSLGIPFYSLYWWSEYSDEKGGYSTGSGISYKEVRGLLENFNKEPTWLEEQGCYYSFWENDGIFEYTFIEDARSLELKLNLHKKYKLRGISVWRLGQEDPEMWEVLSK